ncbi:uncharacterized protein LOC120841474 isoform X1 [Ixodes scapularis]|uniref:uncharacterized protein LOC120841474 isoform X1 n=1 Tax=Ixodes scapularis TaxID=6945 RepID=UPI001A9FC583|nr:uncharacterized protein LOC120841474 isoform X1 [Ixodes scapularis]
MSVDTGAYDGVALAPSSGSNLTGSRDERSRCRDRDRRSERSRGRETDYHGSNRDPVRGDRIKRGVDRSMDRGPDRGPDHRGGDRSSNRGRDWDRDRDFLDASPNNRDMAAGDIDYREFNEPPDQHRRREAHHSSEDDRDCSRWRDQDQDRNWARGDQDLSWDRSLELNLRDREGEREEIPNDTNIVRGMPIETIQLEPRNEVIRYGLEPKDDRLMKPKDTGASQPWGGTAATEQVLNDMAEHRTEPPPGEMWSSAKEPTPPWRSHSTWRYPEGPPDGNTGWAVFPNTQAGEATTDQPGPEEGRCWFSQPDPHGGQSWGRQHRGWPNGRRGQRRWGSAGTARPTAVTPSWQGASPSAATSRHGAGPSAATSRHGTNLSVATQRRKVNPSARAPPQNKAAPSGSGGPAWSRRPCHTVATWTACGEGEAILYVSRQRWKHQPRPTPGQPDNEVPHPFRGHTLPSVPRVLGEPDTCWLCGVPIIHLETHEAGQLHRDLLEAHPLPGNVVAAVQLLRRSCPDLLAPAAVALVQPVQLPTNPAAAPVTAVAAVKPAATTAPTTSAASSSSGPSHRAGGVQLPPLSAPTFDDIIDEGGQEVPPSSATNDDIMAEVEEPLGKTRELPTNRGPPEDRALRGGKCGKPGRKKARGGHAMGGRVVFETSASKNGHNGASPEQLGETQGRATPGKDAV